MKLLSVLAATAVAAAVAAAITIPAGASPADDPAAQLVSCLRAHGADVPAGTTGLALKQWVGDHESDPAVAACRPPGGGAIADRVACLKDHGLNPPSSVEELKPWLVAQSRTDAGNAAMKACGMEIGRPDGDGRDPKDLASCLRAHGATGAPDGSDPVALKEWIGAHPDDAAVDACGVEPPGPGPDKPAGCAAPAPTASPTSTLKQ
jgi:hypothetical protein